MVFLLFFLPVVLSLFFGGGALAYTQILQSKLLGACRNELMSGQKKARKNLRQLLAMNASVRAHHKRRIQAERQLQAAKTTLNPKLIAAAKAYHLLVLAEGVTLRKTQESIIAEANVTLQTSGGNAALKLQASFRKMPGLEEKWLFQNLKTNFQYRPLAVEPVSLDSPSEYRPKSNFETEQTQELQWSYSFMPQRSKWLGYFYHAKANFSDQCGVSLEQTSSFAPLLREDRWLSKVSLPFSS